MWILILILVALPLAAQTGPPDIIDCYLTSTKAGAIGDRSVSLKCSLSGGTAADYDSYEWRFNYGYVEGTLDRRPPVGDPALAGEDDPDRWSRIQDLAPSDTIYIGPSVSNSDQSVWSSAPICTDNCAGGDDATFCDENDVDGAMFADAPGVNHSFIKCVAGENWRFDTAALDASPPVAPSAPSHSFSATIPAADNTHPVDGTCSDWTTHYDAAILAAETSGTTERITIPAGVQCDCFQLTSLSAGRVQVTSASDANTLPGAGTMIHPGYEPHLAIISHPATPQANWTNNCITMEAAATGWDLFNLAFTEPPGTDPVDYPTSRVSSFVQGTTDATGLRFDRILVDFPSDWDQAGVFNIANSVDVTITNSWVRRDITDESTGTQHSVYCGGAEDFQIINNAFVVLPFVFCDTSVRQSGPMTIEKNIFSAPDSYATQHPDYGGTYQRFTYCLELKNASPALIKGNLFKGCRSDFNNNAGTIAITGVSQQDSDIHIRSNTIKDSQGGIAFSDNNTAGPWRPLYPSERILVEHNLAFGLSNEYCNSASCTTGTFIAVWSPQEDTNITRNTVHVKGGQRPQVLWLSDRGQGHVNENNLYIVTGGGAGNRGVRRLLTAGGMLPAPSSDDGSAAFDQTFIRGTTADALSSFANNVIVPGVEASHTSPATKFSSTADASTISCNEITSDATMTTFSGLTCVGSATACAGGTCPDSMDDRMALAFPTTGSWQPDAAYQSSAADVDGVVEPEQGRIRDVTVSATASGVTISWTAPSTVGLTVQVAPWEGNYNDSFSDAAGDDDADIAEQTDSSVSTSQSLTFDSGTTGALSAETKYVYRIFSDSKTSYVKERQGTFTTAGT